MTPAQYNEYQRQADVIEQAKKWKEEQELLQQQILQQENLYTEEQVIEALFYALNVNRISFFNPRPIDSIVIEAIKILKQNKTVN